MKVDNSQNQETMRVTPSVKSSPSANPSQIEPKSFLSFVFPPSNKLSTDPDPPPKKPTPKNGAEEAATSPNANSQKLDSPLQTKKKPPETTTEADLKSAQSLASQSSESALDKHGSPLDPQALSLPNVAVDEASHLKIKAGLAPLSALPIDAEVPITSVHAFTVGPPAGIPGATSEIPMPVNGVSNPSISAIMGEPSAKLASQTNPTVPTEREQTSDLSTRPTPGSVALTANLATPTHESSSTKHAGEVKSETSHSPISASAATGRQMGFQHPSGQSGDSQPKPEKPDNLSQHQAMDRRTLMASVVNKFETMMAARPRNGVVVQLSPKALGNITVTLKTSGKSVETQIAASHPEVRQALSNSRPELARAIEDRGYTVAGVTVDSQGDQASSSFSQNSSSRETPNPGSEIFSSQQRPRIEALPLALSRRKTAACVDLWI
jgi:flagellar hook-length control protein FliK